MEEEEADAAFSSGCQNPNACIQRASTYDTKDAGALGSSCTRSAEMENGNLRARLITWHKIHFRNF